MQERTRDLIAQLARLAVPVDDGGAPPEALFDAIGDARFVLLGEASHGTHEFYRLRAEITKRLVRERGFTAVAVEADWPDALLVDRFVRGRVGGRAAGGHRALATFQRFPAWMWRNADVLEFVGWLRAHNERLPRSAPRVGFYGLDLYSTAPSAPDADGPATAWTTRAHALVDGDPAHELRLLSEQQLRLERNSSAYFEAVFRGQSYSWNLRERHMDETVSALVAHQRQERPARPVKLVIWEHNSHVGDARATQMGRQGELSLGQLLRERYPGQAFLCGFTTYSGSVIAASGWGARAEHKTVRPAHPSSFEAMFHETGIPRFLLPLGPRRAGLFGAPRLERAIGAVYVPEAELEHHYLLADLPEQFDAVIHLDETSALVPLEAGAGSG